MAGVFVSYSSESKDIASLLKDRLRRRGIKTIWTDWEQILAGQPIAGRIQDGVTSSVCCIFLLNTYSVTSTWCMAEVGAFWGAGKPVVICPIEPRCDPPPFLGGLRRANTAEEVVEACKIIIRDTRPPPPPPPPPPLPTFLRTLQEGGLVNAFRIPVGDPSREHRVEELVHEERQRANGKCFRLAASSGFNYLNRTTGKVWLRGLGHAIVSEGAEFLVVLESPFSGFAETRALANDVEWDHWSYKVNQADLLEISRRYRVSVRVTECAVNCSLFFTSKAVFYDPYLWARPTPAHPNENNFWVFEFCRAANAKYDCYSLLEKHFEFLEHNSEPLEEFLSPNPKSFEDRRNEFHDMLVSKRRSNKNGNSH